MRRAFAAIFLLAYVLPAWGGGPSSPPAPPGVTVSNYISPFQQSNGTIVPAGPYVLPTVGTANFGPSTGQASVDWLNGNGHLHRVRQNGTITQVQACTPTGGLTGVTGYYVKIWRLVGTTYNLVGTTANLVSSLIAGQCTTIPLGASPITGVLEGDYTGGREEFSSASQQTLFATTISNTTVGGNFGSIVYSVLNATPTTTGYNWAGQTATNGVAVLNEVYMAAPVFVAIGDSIISGFGFGNSQTMSYIDNYQLPDFKNEDSSFPIGQAFNYTFQNMGIGGQQMPAIVGRFAADFTNLSPQFGFAEGGVNDLIGGRTVLQIEANWTTLLTAAGTTPLIVEGIQPFANYASSTPTMQSNRNAINAWLQTQVGPGNTFPTAIFLNLDPVIGQYASADAAGNLDALQTQYDSGDGLHPNIAGYAAIAQARMSLLNTYKVNPALVGATLNVGGDATFAGASNRNITVSRNPIAGFPGSNLLFQGGGASLASTNANGGSLILNGGPATGTGFSSVILEAALKGSSGTADTTFGNATLFGTNGIPQFVIG